MKNVETFRKEGETHLYVNNERVQSVVPGPHQPRVPLDTYLVGVKGVRVSTEEDFAITHLRFCFRLMTPSCAGNLFVSPGGDVKCEIDTAADMVDNYNSYIDHDDSHGESLYWDQHSEYDQMSERFIQEALTLPI